MGDDPAGLTLASRAPRRPIARVGDDRFALRFDAQERRILGALVDELRGALRDRHETYELEGASPESWPGPAGDPDDPLARLYPPAFPEDPEAESKWSDLVRPGLDEARELRMDRVTSTLDAEAIDGAAAEAWLGTLNDLRLVIGSQLGISEDDPAPLRGDDPDAARRALFDYLGWLVDSFVDALAAELPEVGSDPD